MPQGLESLVNDVDKSHFRPLQKESFLCQARCCDSARTQADLRNWCALSGLSAIAVCCAAFAVWMPLVHARLLQHGVCGQQAATGRLTLLFVAAATSATLL